MNLAPPLFLWSWLPLVTAAASVECNILMLCLVLHLKEVTKRGIISEQARKGSYRQYWKAGRSIDGSSPALLTSSTTTTENDPARTHVHVALSSYSACSGCRLNRTYRACPLEPSMFKCIMFRLCEVDVEATTRHTLRSPIIVQRVNVSA